MKILLTGPAGFIGSAFLRLALSREHAVAGLFLPGQTAPDGLPQSGRLHRLEGMLAEPPWKQIETFAPEVCVHTAWITAPGVYLESAENYLYLDWSLAFVKRLSERGTRRVVVLGTCIEYAPANHPLHEDRSPVAPQFPYARCKEALRAALHDHARVHDLALAWCRVFYPFGPGEHPARLCSSLIEKIARNETCVLQAPNSTKDFIYITDLAEALLRVVEQGFQGTINLGTGVGVTVEQMAQRIAGLLERPLQAIRKTHPADPYPYVVADATRLRALGWRQAVPLESGLGQLIHQLTG